MNRDSRGRYVPPNYPAAKFHFNLCDWWIGAYWDKKDRRLFLMILPFGVVFDFGPRR